MSEEEKTHPEHKFSVTFVTKVGTKTPNSPLTPIEIASSSQGQRRHNKKSEMHKSIKTITTHAIFAILDYFNVSNVTVEVGDFTSSKSSLEKINATFLVHPGFDAVAGTNDIAILYLAKNISSRRVIPLCPKDFVNVQPMKTESAIVVCGMGMTSWESDKVLQEVKLFEYPECPEDPGSFRVSHPHRKITN